MWFEPFALKTVILDIFAGTPLLFFVVGFLVIVSMAAYFRMRMLAMFFMLVMFVFLFGDYIPGSITTFFVVIAAIAIAMVTNKLWNKSR